ncbi:MAG: methyl-accepting chemotaxis protein [Deltaproteobacteria bacterium]|nr:methyl-accepting chemotaxis protein [Deltaproteobacteria bacterium]
MNRFTLSLKIILSFAAVVAAALVLLIVVVVTAERELATERGLWPGMWELGHVAGSLGPGSDRSAAGNRVRESLAQSPGKGATGPLAEAGARVNSLAQLREGLDRATAEFGQKKGALNLAALELALARPGDGVPAELSDLLASVLGLGDKNPPQAQDVQAVKGKLEAYGAKSAQGAGSALTGALGGLSRSLDDFAAALAALSKAGADLSAQSAALAKAPGVGARPAYGLWPKVTVGILALLVLSGGLVLLLIAKAIRPLSRIQGWLDKSSRDVTKTSVSLSRSSQSLAKGAAENTKAVLDAISSLEVLLSTAKRNAGHAGQAKALIDRAKSFVDEAHETMLHISATMEEIKNSGEASSQIVKTVDQIAFQTNILALNAAVEAARAGEAGLSFAVVADEVRNLANSSSAAAKNTTSILDSSLRRITEGADLVKMAEKSFEALVTVSDEVANLMTGITEDSQGQAREIQDVHQSIAMMDKVTQENSMEAAEAGNISKELTRQADLLNRTIAHVASVITGAEGAVATGAGLWDEGPGQGPEGGRPGKRSRQTEGARIGAPEAEPVPVKKSFGKPSQKAMDKALPMDDDFF